MKKELKNILVPVDFKEPSLKALLYAKNLANSINADIILLHVVSTPGWVADFFTRGGELVDITNSIKDKMSKLIENEFGKNSKVKVSSVVVRGKPYEEILKTAVELNVRMVILGENHQGHDANQTLGSTVYHVTLSSKVPVLTLKGDTQLMNKEIVVPLDLTKQNKKQLFSAIAYGLNYNARIHLVSSLIGGIKMEESRIYQKLEEAKQTLEDNGVMSTIQLFPRSEEPPFRHVIKYAKEVNAGMILLLTHKEGYTYDTYIGAFAHHIINKSPVPVLTLTSAATNVDFSKFLSSIVDPAGVLLK